MILKGKDRDKFLSKVSKEDEDILEAQLLMAKTTGNFKGENEKTGKIK